jgi:hypothetical protein
LLRDAEEAEPERAVPGDFFEAAVYHAQGCQGPLAALLEAERFVIYGAIPGRRPKRTGGRRKKKKK